MIRTRSSGSQYAPWGRPALAVLMLGAALHLAAPARAADPAPVLTALRIEGVPDSNAWTRAVPTTEFFQREPAEGGSPSERTDVRVLYDATALYVRVHAFDGQPDRIHSYLTRRDVDSPSDWIHVMIDSYHDRRTAYEFMVNPAGVKRDAYWYNDNSRDDSWDAVWDVSVSRDAEGWSADFRIPFSQLRFNPTSKTTFGFAVSREVARLNETTTWPLLARSATGYVSEFGELHGLTMQGSPSRLEVVPYTVGQVTAQPTGGNPLIERVDPGLAIGVDAKYALTPGLTLTTTINPDFGQVEADPAVVNLSAFETFFQERRPFFVEGAGNFAFGLDCPGCNGIFYSRRIGRAPQGSDALPEGDDVYTRSDAQTTILGAAKVTGRAGPFSLGVLHSVTREEEARVLDGAQRFAQPIEPLTNYSVLTARREFRNQSSIGAMATSTNRQQAPGLEFLVDHAHVGGVNFDWRFARRLALNGNLVGSHVSGDPEAIDRLQRNSRHYFQRPDAPVDRLDISATTLSGAGGRLGIEKIGGQTVRFNSNVSVKSPGLEVNDLGFMQRADERQFNNWIQFRSDRPNRWFRSRNINFNQYARWNYDGELLGNGGNVNAHVVFTNNWRIGGGLNLNARGLDDRASRGGPAALVEGMTSGWFYVNSDGRRAVNVNYEQNMGGDRRGSSFINFEPELSVRPMPQLNASFALRISHDVQDSQWIENVTGPTFDSHYVFGHLDQRTVSLRTRVSYTMTPNVSLQLYAEPFVSAGHYIDFKELLDGRNPSYAARYGRYAYGTNPDFNVKSFRTTNVLRWEYRPGSSLFVVWQQARSGSNDQGTFRFSRDVGDIFRTEATNVVLVKFAYWLNF